MRLSCFMPPCRQRSGAPGRSRRSASYTNFTCLHVDRNTTVLACRPPRAPAPPVSALALSCRSLYHACARQALYKNFTYLHVDGIHHRLGLLARARTPRLSAR